jgi:hypothetical protein
VPSGVAGLQENVRDGVGVLKKVGAQGLDKRVLA